MLGFAFIAFMACDSVPDSFKFFAANWEMQPAAAAVESIDDMTH